MLEYSDPSGIIYKMLFTSPKKKYWFWFHNTPDDGDDIKENVVDIAIEKICINL